MAGAELLKSREARSGKGREGGIGWLLVWLMNQGRGGVGREGCLACGWLLVGEGPCSSCYDNPKKHEIKQNCAQYDAEKDQGVRNLWGRWFYGTGFGRSVLCFVCGDAIATAKHGQGRRVGT